MTERDRHLRLLWEAVRNFQWVGTTKLYWPEKQDRLIVKYAAELKDAAEKFLESDYIEQVQLSQKRD